MTVCQLVERLLEHDLNAEVKLESMCLVEGDEDTLVADVEGVTRALIDRPLVLIQGNGIPDDADDYDDDEG